MADSNETQSFIDMITGGIEGNSILWILLYLGLGGAITAVINYIFQNTLPELKKKRATRIAIQKYSYPISASAFNLRRSLSELLSDPNKIEDERFCLALLYDFGCFLGWSKIFYNESFLEQSKESSYGRESISMKGDFATNLNIYLSTLLLMMSEPVFLLNGNVKIMSSKEIKSATIPRSATSAMGEFMINESKEGGELSPTVIRLVDFEKNLKDYANFKEWFSYLNNLITGINNSISNPSLNRLVQIHTYLNLLEILLKRKREFFLYCLIPRKVKKYFYFFISHKLSTYQAKNRARYLGITWSDEFSQTEDEIILYGSIFLKFKKYLNRKHSMRKYKDLDDPTKFVVEKSSRDPTKLTVLRDIVEGKDNIRYFSIRVPLRYPNLKRYSLDHGYNEMLRLHMASQLGYGYYLRKMHPKILHNLRSILYFPFGYLALSDRPYNDEIYYIDRLLREDSTNRELWNDKGILQSQLTNFLEAVECFNQAIKLNQKYADAWNNKGLTYIMTEDYEEAIKCFEQAKTIWKNDLPNKSPDERRQNLLRICDSLNNKGVAYFNLEYYESALMCFEEASDTLESNLKELENLRHEIFNIISTNKGIAQSKLANKMT